MTRVKAPCKGCGERHVGCHSTCEKYLIFKAESDKLREDRLKQRQLADYLSEAEGKRGERRQK